MFSRITSRFNPKSQNEKDDVQTPKKDEQPVVLTDDMITTEDALSNQGSVSPPVNPPPATIEISPLKLKIQQIIDGKSLSTVQQLRNSQLTKKELKNREHATTILLLVLSLGTIGSLVATGGSGIIIIPFLFGIGLALKNAIINSNLSQEDLLLIENILYMFALLKACPTIEKILEHKACMQNSATIKPQPPNSFWNFIGRSTSTPIVFTSLDQPTQCRDVTTFENQVDSKWEQGVDTKIVAFISGTLDEFIKQLELMVIMLSDKRAKGNAKKIIIDAHSKCSGISTTILNYLKLNNETPTIESLQQQPMFVPQAANLEIQQAYTNTSNKSKLLIETAFEKVSNFVLFTGIMFRNAVYHGGKSVRRKKRRLTRKLKY